jgi:glycogen synthase
MFESRSISWLQLLSVCVQSGLLHSDFVTTVSPTYAKEVLTPEVRDGI